MISGMARKGIWSFRKAWPAISLAALKTVGASFPEERESKASLRQGKRERSGGESSSVS